MNKFIICVCPRILWWASTFFEDYIDDYNLMPSGINEIENMKDEK